MAKKGVAEDVKFSKEQLYNSKKYEMYKDIIGALLDDATDYTTDEVDKIIDDFLKKEVN